jgi:hypothetical protein
MYLSNMNSLGGWAIDESCYKFIREILKDGSTILEFGSGFGTEHLCSHYTMYSIEHDKEWIGKYDSNYIYAPLKSYDDTWKAPDVSGENSENQYGWYDPSYLIGKLPKKYDLILVDGPYSKVGRAGFLKHIDLFDSSVPIVFDDIHRKSEFELMVKVSEYLKRDYYKLDQKTGYVLQ